MFHTHDQPTQRKALMPDPAEEWVIHPYYTGRDKGPLMRRNPNWKTEGGATHIGVLTFPTEEAAWDHIHTVVQPNDPRADHNYRVYTIDRTTEED